VPLEVRNGSAMSILRTNIDPGGILYSDDHGDSREETASIALEIPRCAPGVLFKDVMRAAQVAASRVKEAQ
jgi:hypothetical protein